MLCCVACSAMCAPAKGRTNLHTYAARSYAYACVLNPFALRAFVETFIAAYACVLKSLHPCVRGFAGSSYAVAYLRFPFDLSVRAGSSHYGTDGQLITVSQITEHENYFQHSADYDIALLELSEEVTAQGAKPIELCKSRPVPGTEAVVSGWGRTSLEDKTKPYILQVVKLPVIDQKICKDAYGERKNFKYKITERMICAGNINHDGEGACLGDSGGPMVANGKLVGLVSWGRGCAVAGYPGVYASIADLRDWIDENMLRYSLYSAH
ncbi:hypothetical protein NQ318_022235 [Aromia moschata]|uniref:trypsin n=1 Tax=Aromia moschata TaxID=1265417 RepID=A0AAV8XLW0_9CUCU|nr:hypothetical protein NQ318_022235 [Aromia moschata]